MESLSCIADYYADRLRAATTFSLYRLTNYPVFADATRSYVEEATKHWDRLATIGEDHYKRFIDTLRMHTEHFTWRKEGENLARALVRMEDIVPSTAEPLFGMEILDTKGDGKGPIIETQAEVSPAMNGVKTLTVRARVEDPAGLRAVLLKIKPLPSESRWHRMPMSLENGRWTATVQVSPHGLQWCVEALDKDGNGTMWPDFRTDIPYRIIEPWEDPSVLTDNMSDVLDRILNGGLERERYSAMFIGSSSVTFNHSTPDVKAKVLKAVEQGMPLIIDCQDFPGFDLSWLPGNLKGTRHDSDEVRLDTTHPLLQGLAEETTGLKVVNDAFESGDAEWTFITDPKAIAI